jgi:RHS repeat-associated protein
VSLGYDAASRITSAQESGTTGSRIFDYDPLDRLIHTQVPSAVYDYSYDATGNRLTEKVASTTFNYTYPTTSHRLASVSGPKARSFSYDANGSMTGNGSQQFVYNSLGRLHQVITAQGTYQYRINGLGQRVMKIPPTGNRTIFHYDENGRLLAETDGLGVVVKEFIWHGATPVAVVLPPTSTKPERIYYIHADQLNTPRVIVNNSNAVLWRWDPEPFGTALPNEDVDGNGEKLVMNIRYPGQYYDQETGLNYNNFRDYDASIGRYVQSDPIGLAGGINTYSYVNGNPVNFVDPRGLSGKSQRYYLPNSPYIPGSPANKYWAKKLSELCDRMFSEADDSTDNDEGCIYCVNGKNTSSGKDYIGSTDNLGNRKRDKSDGRDREGAEVVDTYEKGNRDDRRTKEQQAINDKGGVDNLDNNRNEVAPKYWPQKGITPP